MRSSDRERVDYTEMGEAAAVAAGGVAVESAPATTDDDFSSTLTRVGSLGVVIIMASMSLLVVIGCTCAAASWNDEAEADEASNEKDSSSMWPRGDKWWGEWPCGTR